MSEPAGSPAPRVFTVPPGRPFLTCLAEALLAGDLPSPGGAKPDLLTLPDVTLLMPTRRATRALQEAFLAAGGGQAMLLPAIRPISEADEELSLLTELAGLTSAHASARDIAPAIPDMERRLTLTRLVLAWSERMRDAHADEAGEKLPLVMVAVDFDPIARPRAPASTISTSSSAPTIPSIGRRRSSSWRSSRAHGRASWPPAAGCRRWTAATN